MAVVLLDINELKRINDLYGHSEGTGCCSTSRPSCSHACGRAT